MSGENKRRAEPEDLKQGGEPGARSFPETWPDHNKPGLEDEATRNAVLSFLKRLDDIDGRERTEAERWNEATWLVGYAHAFWWITEGPGRPAPVERDKDDTWRSRRRTRIAFWRLLRLLKQLPSSARANTAGALALNLPKPIAAALSAGDIPKAGDALDLFQVLLGGAIRGLKQKGRRRGVGSGASKSAFVFRVVDSLHAYLGRMPKEREKVELLKILLGNADRTATREISAAMRQEEKEAKAAIAAANRNAHL